MKARLTVIAAALAMASTSNAADEGARNSIPGATVTPCPLGTVPSYYGPHKSDYTCVRKPESDQRMAAGHGPNEPSATANEAASARGIEKKDIRRGMVIAKPGSITPHARAGAPAGSRPIEDEAQGSPEPNDVTIKCSSTGKCTPRAQSGVDQQVEQH